MSIRTIFFFIFLINPLSVSTQGTLKVDSVEQVILGRNLTLVCSQNRIAEFSEGEIEVRELASTEIENAIARGDAVLSVNDLKKETPTTLLSKLKGKTLTFESNWGKQFLSFMGSNFCINGYLTNGVKIEGILHALSLNINNEFTAILIRDDDGEEVFSIFILKSNRYIVNGKMGELLGEVPDEIFEDGLFCMRRLLEVTEDKEGKKGASIYSDDKLSVVSEVLSCEYDSLFVSGNYICAYKGQTPFLFNLYGEDIWKKRFEGPLLESVFVSDFRYAQTLSTVGVGWIDWKGNRFYNKPNYVIELCGTVPSTVEKLNIKDGSVEYNVKVFQSELNTHPSHSSSFRIKKTKDFDEIFFLNREKRFSYTSNDISSENRYEERLLNHYLVKKGTKYGICKIDWDGGKIEIVVPVQLDYVQMGQFPHTLLFRENGLYGYFPQMKKGRYWNASKFDGGFGHFELEKGKEGWIDVNGREFYKE